MLWNFPKTTLRSHGSLHLLESEFLLDVIFNTLDGEHHRFEQIDHLF
jgi:hypothetical protein